MQDLFAMIRVPSSFDSRLLQIENRNRRLSKGAVRYVLDDGLVVLMPKAREGVGLALFIVMLTPLMAALGAKSYLLARLDSVALGEVLARFETMGGLGRALVWLMQPDALTTALAGALTGLLG